MTTLHNLLIFRPIQFLVFAICLSISVQAQQKPTVTKAKTPAKKESNLVTPRNQKPLRAALDAVTEIESVMTVGANFVQFTSTLQSARIKFDRAMGEFRPVTSGDREVQSQLSGIWECYLDAKQAWKDFIDEGEYGAIARGYLSVNVEGKYGLKPKNDIWMKNGQMMNNVPLFYRSEVVGTILSSASTKIALARKRIK